MKTMTWEEIDKDWFGLQKRHRMEIAQAVARYCIGHKMDEVGNRLGYDRDWVRVQLDYAGISNALGLREGKIPPLTGSTDNVAKEMPRVLKEFAPKIDIKLAGQGGDQRIVGVNGKDAEDFQPYLDHYINEGYEPAAATRLAKAEWAAEAAQEAGVIKEDVNKRNEKVNRILFPDHDKDTFEIDFKMHMARVKSAASFLDKAKMNRLRSKQVREGVAQADAEWRFQVERIVGHIPTLNKD